MAGCAQGRGHAHTSPHCAFAAACKPHTYLLPVQAYSTKLDAMEGRQGKLAAAVGSLQADVSAQGSALQGLGQTCSQLLQVGTGLVDIAVR